MIGIGIYFCECTVLNRGNDAAARRAHGAVGVNVSDGGCQNQNLTGNAAISDRIRDFTETIF
jgi:hypothetical protein